MRSERKLSRLLPPNMDAAQVKGWIIALLTIVALLCAILFLGSYPEDYRNLFLDWGTKRQRFAPGMIIPRFDRYAILTAYVIGGALVLTLASAALLYSSYYQGSRSIYLMRRLPDGRSLLRRQVWTVPVCWALMILVNGAVLLGLCWLLWRFKTPAECLPTPENIARAEALDRAGLYIRYQ